MKDITITEHPGCDHVEWKVEERYADGENDVAVFVGPNAEYRANFYLDWLRTGLD
jgi:hypothetical protein